jgi:transcriptional regulator with XRE-family HTH domain
MNRIKLLRYDRGLTMSDVQVKTGVSYPTLRALEEADEPQPTAPIAKTLADFYEVTVAELLGIETKDAA